MPVPLTSSPLSLSAPLPSRDGTKIFTVGRTLRGELVRYDSKAGQFVPFLSGISALGVTFSKDGQWVAYVSYPQGELWRSRLDGSEHLLLAHAPPRAILPRWSPDGKQIVFCGASEGKPNRAFIVSADGGIPRPLMPDDPKPQWDPNWSPDGSKIVFGGAYIDANSVIRVLDLRSHQISLLPGSKGFFSPHWSPNGRYIVAMPVDALRLVLFDLQTQNRSELTKGSAGSANWSRDGQYVYFFHWPENHPAVMRVRISDRKVERVVDLKNVPLVSIPSLVSLAPDDSPLLLRNAGSQDIYAADWEAL